MVGIRHGSAFLLIENINISVFRLDVGEYKQFHEVPLTLEPKESRARTYRVGDTLWHKNSKSNSSFLLVKKKEREDEHRIRECVKKPPSAEEKTKNTFFVSFHQVCVVELKTWKETSDMDEARPNCVS